MTVDLTPVPDFAVVLVLAVTLFLALTAIGAAAVFAWRRRHA